MALLTLLPGAGRAADTAAPAALWVRDGRLTRQALELLAIMRRAADFGLAPGDFSNVTALDDADADPGDPRQMDARLSTAALRLVQQLHQGRVDPSLAGYALRRHRPPIDGADALRRLAAATDVGLELQTFEPKSAQYHELERVLARYRRISAEQPSFAAAAAAGAAVRPGEAFADAGLLRRWLAELGDLADPPAGTTPDDRYDPDLSAAVARFQKRHGLTPDGILGKKTLSALAVPLARRIRQIELTLERWRWLPDLAPPAVIVNVPQYVLYALRDPSHPAADGSPVLRIPVIVGQTLRQTPIFDSAIQAVVFRPYWNVPESIVHDEILPAIARDGTYLARHELDIVRGDGDAAQVLPVTPGAIAALRAGRAGLRQRPGPNNSLGLIKFELPNPYSVYLHSTPEMGLFAREQRALSHGCIRVSDASALATYLLSETPGDWSAGAIETATCGPDNLTVRLARPVPIFILYGTAVIDADGSVMFFDDVYGYDGLLDALLEGRTTPFAGRSAGTR